MAGIIKSKNYLRTIKNAIAHDSTHPRNNGIAMQAHHLISGKGASFLNKDQIEIIEASGYDINDLSNLVFLPCTLPGACHLGVQLHRGNHTAPLPQEDDHDDDGEHPISYHLLVANKLKKVVKKYKKDGFSKEKNCIKKTKLKNDLEKVSKKILFEIELFKLPLTGISISFNPISKVGCGNVKNIPSHSEEDCTRKRNHFNQKDGKKIITYAKPAIYKLKAGK